MDHNSLALESHRGHITLDDTSELTAFINSFPTTNQPILDTTMKEMLVSLRSSLHTDITTCVQSFKN